MSRQSLEIRVSNSLGGVDAEAWDALVGEGSPFLEYAWLRGLEVTGCVEPEEGWLPQIMTAWRGERLVGAIPLYVKGHSRGEFVYDWSWANLAAQLRVPYYPKLIAASPFTPVTGDRLLVHPDLEAAERAQILDALIGAALNWARETGVAGLHFLFVAEWQAEVLRSRGLMIRLSYQFHWKNPGYTSFEDFLGRFRAHRRTQIRREIRGLQDAKVRLEFLSGQEIQPAHVDAVRHFYKATCEKFGPWTDQYLKDAFFDHVRVAFAHRTQLVLALDADDRPVAGTFSLIKGDRLYGRYWGCDEDIPFLHFNACYYAPIERAIALGVKVYEPGAGGHHKLARGFEPTLTHSAHWLADPRLADLLERHLHKERAAVIAEVEAMSKGLPFKVNPDP